MIKNERQYRITKSQVANFERALRKLEEEPDKRVHPRLRQAELDGVRSQLEEMREEIAEYEELKRGRPKPIVFESMVEMLQGLTRARIARGLSQKALGEKLNLKEQQIQRYEATDYASCSTSRVSDVMRALDISIEGKTLLPVKRNRGERSARRSARNNKTPGSSLNTNRRIRKHG